MFYRQEGHFITAGYSLRDLQSQTHPMASSPGQRKTAAAQKWTSPPQASGLAIPTWDPGGFLGAGFGTSRHLHTRLVCGHTSKLLKPGKRETWTFMHHRGAECRNVLRGSEAPTVRSCSEAGRRHRLTRRVRLHDTGICGQRASVTSSNEKQLGGNGAGKTFPAV